jgi:transcription elongation factor GreA
MGQNYMTKENYNKLNERLDHLKGPRRKEISKAVGEAREGGDLRENSAYHAAKEEQGLNEMKIRDLEQQLASAVVVSRQPQENDGQVRLGSTVKIVAQDTEDEFEYTIVHESEADIFENKISTESPIGGGLLGHKKGDVVEVEIPRGQVQFKITEIK